MVVINGILYMFQINIAHILIIIIIFTLKN